MTRPGCTVNDRSSTTVCFAVALGDVVDLQLVHDRSPSSSRSRSMPGGRVVAQAALGQRHECGRGSREGCQDGEVDGEVVLAQDQVIQGGGEAGVQQDAEQHAAGAVVEPGVEEDEQERARRAPSPYSGRCQPPHTSAEDQRRFQRCVLCLQSRQREAAPPGFFEAAADRDDEQEGAEVGRQPLAQQGEVDVLTSQRQLEVDDGEQQRGQARGRRGST